MACREPQSIEWPSKAFLWKNIEYPSDFSHWDPFGSSVFSVLPKECLWRLLDIRYSAFLNHFATVSGSGVSSFLGRAGV
jgi:hypothetical protein